MGIGDFLTAAEAPWWWSGILALVGALIGGGVGALTAKFQDKRRMAAEREQYFRNRLLDEVALLLGAAERFRLWVLGRVAGMKRTELGKPDRTDPATLKKLKAMNDGLADHFEPVATQASRVQLISAGETGDAAARLEVAARALAQGGHKESKADFESCHTAFKVAVLSLTDTARADAAPPVTRKWDRLRRSVGK